MTVEVVEVPVYVATHDGKPVRGLAREQFTLTVNGRQQNIDYFDVIDRRTDGEATELNRRRMTMLLFDVAHSAPVAIYRGQKAATGFIARSSPYDAYAVATLTARGITLLVPFTTDHLNVQRAIASLSTSRAGDAFGIATTREERAVWDRGPMFEAHGAADSGVDYKTPNDMLEHWIRANERDLPYGDVRNRTSTPGSTEESRVQRQTRDMSSQLGELATTLRPIEGQKSVVLLTQGIGLDETGYSLPTAATLTRMHESFRNAGVILDAVDLSGLTGPFDSASNPLLIRLAVETGGHVQRERNDFLAALTAIEEMESVVYRVGFRPPANQQATNSVRVRVTGLGALTDVRYRKSYSTERSGDAMNTVLLADVLLNDIPQNGVSLDTDVESAENGASVSVSVPGRELLAYVGGKQATADVFIYVFDQANLVAGFGRKLLKIDAVRGDEYLRQNPLQTGETLKLAPGHYVAKVLFRVRGTEATGFTRTEFDVGG
jgi:VWFA-related protein